MLGSIRRSASAPSLRDLAIGHFVPGGDLVVDVPLSPGPNGMRAVGEHIALGFTPAPVGAIFHFERRDRSCIAPIGSFDPDGVTLMALTCLGDPDMGFCSDPLTLTDVGSR